MKSFTKTMIFIILLVTSVCHAQTMKTIDDIYKLDSNKSCFLGKTVKNLLSEIGPEIKMVKLGPGNDYRPSYIKFYFMSTTDYKIYFNQLHKEPAFVRIMVRGYNFPLNWFGLNWTPQIEKELKNLIIGDISVLIQDH